MRAAAEDDEISDHIEYIISKLSGDGSKRESEESSGSVDSKGIKDLTQGRWVLKQVFSELIFTCVSKIFSHQQFISLP